MCSTRHTRLLSIVTNKYLSLHFLPLVPAYFTGIFYINSCSFGECEDVERSPLAGRRVEISFVFSTWGPAVCKHPVACLQRRIQQEYGRGAKKIQIETGCKNKGKNSFKLFSKRRNMWFESTLEFLRKYPPCKQTTLMNTVQQTCFKRNKMSSIVAKSVL